MRVFWRSPAAARPLLLDCGLVAVVLGASLLMGSDVLLDKPEGAMFYKEFRTVEEWQRQLLWWWLAAAPTAVSVFLRHHRPVTALTLAAAGTAGHLMSPLIPHLPLDLVTLVTLFTLAGTVQSRRVSVAALIAVEAGLYGFNLTVVSGAFAPLRAAGKFTFNAPPLNVASLDGDPMAQAAWLGIVPALLLAIAWAAGDNARTRRAHLATLEARAADLEREQEQRTALAVAAERGRITRELHDVVAHGLSVMVVQAQGAQAALRRHPERSEVALTNVITTGRASLAEMRRLLGLVRSAPGPQFAPQPSLAALPELIERVRSSGTPVAFHVTGEPATLSTAIELSAYRIIQEALTNTIKHAGAGAGCSVELGFAADRLRIRVRDSGTGADSAPPEFGNGLRGITERVTALGGTLHAGPADHGGFEVSTILPLETPA